MKLLFSLSALSTILSVDSANSTEYDTGLACKPCADTSGTCDIKVTVNLFASQTGFFQVDGCDGVSPTLHLTVGRTYIFDQSDISNWYHLIGISYEHDGSMEPGDIMGFENDCAKNKLCPAPMYFQKGEYKGVYSNNEEFLPLKGDDDFGLDVVEDIFKYPIGNWEDFGPFKTALKYDVPYNQDIFYYCHMHGGMTGRIKLLDDDGNMLNSENTPEIPYEYDVVVDDFDMLCGTYNISDWQLPNDQCAESFACGKGQSDFKNCVDAMDCHMMASMTTGASKGGILALFLHQMIPHHENAVNMAKSLLKLGGLTPGCDRDDRGEKPVGCVLLPILRDIINGQNRQIQKMQKALSQMGVAEFEDCFVDFTAGEEGSGTPKWQKKTETPNRHSRYLVDANSTSAYETGISCTPCEGIDGDCEIKVTVNLFASQTGYFVVDGCDGVSPTLHLSVGRTYIFDQSDISNWYHLIGISYAHDGSMEPGDIPGEYGCAEGKLCPAPMYFQKGEYKGKYFPPEVGNDDFGLDAVEDLFKYPIGNWEDFGPFQTSLNYDVSYNQDIFYYCHMHDGMTGRIKLLDEYGNMLNPEDTPSIPYMYDDVTLYDEECGTFGLADFQLPNDQCPDQFVCNVDPGGGGGSSSSGHKMSLSTFAGCVNSMDCAMLDGMTTKYGGQDLAYGGSDDVALFLYQMIPHHQNAVNMAKSVLKAGEVECVPPVGEAKKSVECRLEPIVRDIINVQNRQIIKMKGLLENINATETSDCDNFDFNSNEKDCTTNPNSKTCKKGSKAKKDSKEGKVTKGPKAPKGFYA